ncbi:MAG: VapE domain-containing protein [Bacteroidota bacterium]
MNVSVFHNFNEVSENMALPVVLEQIRDGRFKSRIEQLRSLLNDGKKKEYDKQKKSLPAFTPSATFEGGRKPEFLVQYTGVLVLDLDKLHVKLVQAIKTAASEIPFTYACFISPGGNGLKILVRTDSRQVFHKQAFEQVKEYYEQLLGQSIDPSGKDITRLCFFSWDGDLYQNTYSQTFKLRTTMIDTDINNVVEQIESGKVDITNDYKDWLTIGFALTDALGEGGREYFHKVSSLSAKYETSACDKQYDKCLKSNGSGVTAKSFFFLAKDQGIDISPVESYDISDYQPPKQEPPVEEQLPKKKRKNQIERIENYLNMNYVLRYNIVSGKLEVRKRAQTGFEPMTDYIENSILRELLKNNILCNSTKLRNILFSDYCSIFDPFAEYFGNLPAWDGETDHISQLAATVSTKDETLWQYCFKKWIVASVASLLDPKVINHTAIIFSGGQGIGKTTWMENLCPKELLPYLFSGTINPSNKDTLVHLSECWFINMDELENMNRTEIGTFKELITKSAIRLRRAYGHNNESLPRRASFMGSVNTSQFLNDTTGSRRFLCFEVSSIRYDHNVDVANVYAQALALVKQGFRFYFNKDEIRHINANNEQYQIKSIEEELLLTWFRHPKTNESPLYLSTSQILTKLAALSKLATSTGNVITLGKVLKKHNFERRKKNGNYVYEVIELTYDQVESENHTSPKEVDDQPETQEDTANQDDDTLPF